MSVWSVGMVGLAGAGALGCVWAIGAGTDVVPPLRRVGVRASQTVRHVVDRWRLAKKERTAQGKATRDLPTFLDVVTLGLSAGLSFDASLELYCDRYHNALSSMVGAALLAWRMGYQSREEALESLAEQSDSVAMERFVGAVVQALRFGAPLADALARQGELIREEQRAQTEEEIERVPVKMLVPLGVLILPAMLLAILGPLLSPVLTVT